MSKFHFSFHPKGGGQAGFTLTEVLVACLIASVLAVVSVSALADWHKKERLKAAQLGIFQLLQQTRVQAITRGRQWSIQDTLTGPPYNFPQGEAYLSTFARFIAETDNLQISVTPETVVFDARGRERWGQDRVITISAPGMEPRVVEVKSSGFIQLHQGVG